MLYPLSYEGNAPSGFPEAVPHPSPVAPSHRPVREYAPGS